MKEEHAKIVGGCIAAVIVGVAVMLIRAVVLMLIWGWAVPFVFAGAVEAHILPSSLTFDQSLTLSILLWVMSWSFQLKTSAR